MQFLSYHAQPKPNTEDIGDTVGAYINCYILEDTIDKADKIARKQIKEMNWAILSREEAYELDSSSVTEDGREYYEQAIIDKAVYVFHTYSSVED